jgi:hypothetical protein
MIANDSNDSNLRSAILELVLNQQNPTKSIQLAGQEIS